MSKKGQEKNYGNATEIIEVHSIVNQIFNDRFKRIKTKPQTKPQFRTQLLGTDSPVK